MFSLIRTLYEQLLHVSLESKASKIIAVLLVVNSRCKRLRGRVSVRICQSKLVEVMLQARKRFHHFNFAKLLNVAMVM